jgi:DNA-binding transcriptional ArsR family regulator
MRLFLNPERRAYLRELAAEFELAPSLVGEELKQLGDAGLLGSIRNGRRVHYRANIQHVLYPELHAMVRKALGMDRIVGSIIRRLGHLKHAFLVDDYAEGKDTGIIDLVLVGHIDQANLESLVRKTERYMHRKIRVLTLTRDEYRAMSKVFGERPRFDLWRRSGTAATPPGGET